MDTCESPLDAVPKKRVFVKLFKIQENVEKAIFMINSGYTYKLIGEILGCDKSAVIAFHQRKIDEGIKFSDLRGKTVSRRRKLTKKHHFVNEPEERINSGRDYADYLADYIAKRNVLQAQRMEEAKKTIKQVHKKRIKDHTTAEDPWFF